MGATQEGEDPQTPQDSMHKRSLSAEQRQRLGSRQLHGLQFSLPLLQPRVFPKASIHVESYSTPQVFGESLGGIPKLYHQERFIGLLLQKHQVVLQILRLYTDSLSQIFRREANRVRHISAP